MKKIAKKAVALLLCLMMFMTYLPLDIFAADEPGNGASGSGNNISGGGTEGGDSTEIPDTLEDFNEMLREYSDGLFLGNSSQIDLVVSKKSTEDYMAGNLIKYTVTYGVLAAPLWELGYDRAQTLFDGYENNEIKVTLPEGLKLLEASNGYTFTSASLNDGSTEYTFAIRDLGSGAAEFSFEIGVYICGNGTDNAIASYNITDAFEFSTSFTVLNKRTNPYTEVETYNQTVSTAPGNFTTVSEDVWGIRKTATSASTDRTNGTATVVYLIEVGLKDGDGEIITSSAAYNRPGRVAFAENNGAEYILINDICSTTIRNGGHSGSELNLQSVTIKKDGTTDSFGFLPGADIILTGALALNTVNVDSTGNNVLDANAPAYTKYIVTAVYDLPESVIEHFENPEAVIDFSNEAILVYQLAGLTEGTDSDDAEISKDMPASNPAAVTAKIWYKDYEGVNALYNNEYGAITVIISSANGQSFKLYNKKSDGTYEAITEEGTSFEIEAGRKYYITAGIPYTVDEVLTTEQQRYIRKLDAQCANLSKTPAELQNWEALIQNEEMAGTITIKKYDDDDLPVNGAVFTVKDSAGNVIAEKATDRGTAEFKHLYYGTYTVEETSVPTGYAGSFSRNVTVGDGDLKSQTFTVTNNKRFATIRVSKYVGIGEASSSLARAASTFGGLFVLQRTLDGTNWENVTTDIYGVTISNKVDSQGQITVNVYAFDESGAAYTYRFEETIPQGYYDPSHIGMSVVYSQATTLVDESDKARRDIVNVDMVNRQYVTVEVTKEFWNMQNSGTMVKDTVRNTDITLYKWDGTSMTAVGTKSAGASGKAIWTDLPLYDGDTALSYYVTEEETEGYELDLTRFNSTKKVIEGVTYIPLSLSGTKVTATLKNIEQVIPIIIYSKNYYTKAFVSGSSITVKSNGSVVNDARTGNALSNISIDSANGIIVFVKPGASYSIIETVNNTGLIQVNATEASPIVINLSSIASLKEANTSQNSRKSAIVYNKPLPKLSFTKVDSITSATSALLKTAEFNVYTKNGDNTFSIVKNADGTPVVVKGDGAASTARFTPGEYYLVETVVPTGYLDPNAAPSVYVSQYPTTRIQGMTDDGYNYLFTKITISDASRTESSTADNICSFGKVFNIKNTGSVKVTKYIDGQLARVAGFPVIITDGVHEYTGTTDNKGVVTISNIPVYDASGSKITYTVLEGTLSSALSQKYTKVFDGQQVQLSLNATTAVDTDGNELCIKNKTFIKLEARKAYKHTWEYAYTNTIYLTSGTEIGLFELNESTNEWVKIASKVTDGSGTATFDNINRDKSYAAVELSCPDRFMYPIQNGTKKIYAGNITTIPAADLVLYNALTIEPESDENPRSPVTSMGTLINQDDWVQFDIKMFLDHDKTSPENPEFGQSINTSEDSLHDNDIVQLYRFDMPEGQTNVSFDLANLGGWKLVGTYSSGSVYDDNGHRLVGELMTDVDQGTDNRIVYMVVQRAVSSGDGSVINPNFQYTFWQAPGQSYTANLTGSNTSNVTLRNKNYVFNSKTQDMLLDGCYIDQGGSGAGLLKLNANIRLAKWMDYFDENGVQQLDYMAFPGVKFGIYLDEELTVKLEDLTVGLDNTAGSDNVKAWAHSSLYTLRIADYHTSTTGTLITYGEGTEVNNSVALNLIYSDDDCRIYSVPVYIKEESAPDGFAFSGEYIKMDLCFVYFNGKSVTALNDAFFVTSKQNVNADYPDVTVTVSDALVDSIAFVTWTAQDPDNGNALTDFKYGDTQARIVNYQMSDTRVTIKDFGYLPDNATIGRTGKELKDMTLSNLQILSNVEFSFEKFDTATNTWRYFNYNEKDYSSSEVKIKTNENGLFIFPTGLPAGKYRIIQKDITAYNGIYENAYADAAHAREFVVGSTPLTINIFNPEKVAFSITKKNVEGTAVQNNTFTLTPSSGSAIAKVTDENGLVEYIDIASGIYKLTETAPAGLSKDYFVKYINSLNNSELNALVSTGSLIGYSYKVIDTSDGKDVIIEKIGFNSTDYSIEVVNPDLSSFTVKKVAEDDTTKTLKGAKFQLYYKPFTSYTGETAITGAGTSWTGWTNKSTFTIGNNGLFEEKNLTPGIYAFYETAAPSGYDIIKTKDNKNIVYFVIVTGGMNVTVTGLPSSVTAYAADGTTEMTVTTLFTNPETVTVKNRAKTKVDAKATVTSGNIDSSTLTWEIRLDIYDAATGGTKLGSATISNTTTGTVVFKNGANDVLFSQGKTYYVQETVVSTPATDYALTGIKVNSQSVAASGSRYPVKVVGTEIIHVEANNEYRRGTVVFRKVDVDEPSRLLPGAQFTVCAEDGFTAIQGATVRELLDENNKGTGIYTADIPISAGLTVYKIVETVAPTDYLLRGNIVLSVSLSPSDNVKDWRNSSNSDEYLVNKKGWNFTINKFANIHTATDPERAEANDASFTLYHFNPLLNQWEVELMNIGIDSNGRIAWLLIPEDTYAVSETSFNTAKFIENDSWFKADGTEITGTVETITVGDSEVEAFVLRNVSADICFNVYNKPYIKVKISSEDASGYTATIPVSEFVIYEIEEPLPDDKTLAEQVIASLEGKTPVYTGKTLSTEGNKTYTLWEGCDPTKNYVVVETKLEAKGSGVYSSINKDDNRVVWYLGIDATTDPDTSTAEEYSFKNVHADEVTVDISASVVQSSASSTDAAANTDNASVNSKVKSLLAGDRKVVYKITPSASGNNQALSGLTITDSGITFSPVTNDYAITSINIGKAQQNVSSFSSTITDAKVSAVVTWLDKDGNEIMKGTASDLSADCTISAPAGAVAFTVEYYSDEVKAATNDEYVLGQNFSADPITVNATVKQQPDGTKENPVEEIDSFSNNISAEVKYPRWNETGTEKTEKSATDSATAVITVEDAKYPKVGVTVTSNPAAFVEVGYKVNYTIKVKNYSDTESLVDPVILNMLPTGVSFSGNYTIGSGTYGEEFVGAPQLYIGESVPISENEDLGIAGDSDKAVVTALKGTLLPGSELTITLEGDVNLASVLYGKNLNDYVFVSSDKTSWHTEGNPNGYSFTGVDGVIPGTLSEAAEELGEGAQMRESLLHDVLGVYADDVTAKYVWVKDSSSIVVSMQASMTLDNSIKGDRDSDFNNSSDFLATATRTNTAMAVPQYGWVDFRFSVINGTEDTKQYFVIGDAIPKAGDSLGSVWSLNYDSISFVSIGNEEVDASDYSLFFYTGSVSSASAAVDAAMLSANLYASGSAWSQSGTVLPEGWHAAADVTDKSTVTAVVLLFNEDIVLEGGDSIIVVLHTVTDDVTNDEEFAVYAFENANNEFKTNWRNSMRPMCSSRVVSIIMDGNVDVGGDIWIDEDNDGVQNPDGNIRNYDDYTIVQRLKDSLKLYIKDERTFSAGVKSSIAAENTYMGESIYSYKFTDLGQSAYVPGKGELYVNGELNKEALKTSDPYVYSLYAVLGDTELLDIFKISTLGEDSYMSDNPDAIPDDNALDNNFFDENGMFVTRPFYLRYASAYDQSKDIGFAMERDLMIDMVAADNETVSVGQTKFSVYGPYDEGTADGSGAALTFTEIVEEGVVTGYRYDPNGTVTELVTNDSGKIYITGLNWWKEYVIKEIEASDGFEIAGSTAAGDDSAMTNVRELSGVESAWVLELPSKEKEEKLEKITIKGVRKVEVVIEAEKNVIDEKSSGITLKDDDFTFDLFDSEMNLITSKGVLADGTVTFDAFELTAEGTYTFYIKENIPEAENKIPYYVYSDEVITVTVTVQWDDTEEKFTAAVVYSDSEGETLAKAVITNNYIPAPVRKTISVINTIEGCEPKTDKDFEFIISAVSEDAPLPEDASLIITGEGNGYFDEIVFTDPGVYTYEVYQVEKSYNGYEPDMTRHTVVVTVTGTDGVITATYTVDDGTDETDVEFNNIYAPASQNVTIPVTNVISGKERPAEKTFDFEITTAEGNPLPEDVLMSIIGEGSDNYEITFNKEGVYVYEISEKEGRDTGYTYDDKTYVVTVTVTDEDGILVPKVSIVVKGEETEVSEAMFENNYAPIQTETVITAETILKNMDLEEGMFEFVVSDENGEPVHTSTNGADGQIVFDASIFTEAGEYTFTITQTKGDNDRFVYDTSIFTVKITVTDEDGNLKAVAEYSEDPIFVNEYVAPVPTNDGISLIILAYVCIISMCVLIRIKRRNELEA